MLAESCLPHEGVLGVGGTLDISSPSYRILGGSRFFEWMPRHPFQTAALPPFFPG